jgi:hypothetical protein
MIFLRRSFAISRASSAVDVSPSAGRVARFRRAEWRRGSRLDGVVVDDAVLSFRGVERRGFPHESWRWVYVWEFALLSSTAGTPEILRALLDDEHYAYSFIAPYPSPRVTGPKVRGPFLLARLDPDSFIRTNSEQAWWQLDEFLQKGDPVASRSDLDIDRLVGNVLYAADEVLSLRAPDDGDKQELAWIIGDWGEFIAIDRARRVVLDVAMGYD